MIVTDDVKNKMELADSMSLSELKRVTNCMDIDALIQYRTEEPSGRFEMLFNSYIFVLLFLPLTLFGYFVLAHFNCFKAANVYLLGMSLWFYAYFNLNYLPIILCSLVFNFFVSRLFEKIIHVRVKQLLLYFSIACNLFALCYFKYFDFFITNINAIFSTEYTLRHLLLPLGISFFTFQQISFVVDSYRGEVPRYSFVEYAVFVSYFPQLSAGPIVTHDELIPQLLDKKTRKLNWNNFAKGLYIFALGLGKKVLIADIFGNAANWGFSNIASINSFDALLTMLAYTVQIYFDFSGYCDMAIGIGTMMNIDLPANFDSPYKSLTIVEFWSRWHKTLTRFFTKYIYIPLGGSRKGQVRTYVNTMIVFLCSGFWHGANWTFVLWGVMHGIFNVITKMFKARIEKLHPAFNWIVTFLFVNITWVFFRANSISEALMLIGNIASLNFGPPNPNFVTAFTLPEISMLLTAILHVNILDYYGYFYMVAFFCIAFSLLLGARNAKEHMDTFRPTLLNNFCVVAILVWAIFSMSSVSSFLYFNF